MRIAVVGAFGQLGSDLCRVLGEAAIPFGHADVELTNPVSIDAALRAAGCDAVVNCAAYNLVDKAEDEPEVAFAVNAFGPRHLARWCDAHAVPLLHVSTDYVFGLEGARTTPYREEDVPGPVSVYAQSKLAGEGFVRASCPRSWIVRTCGLYGHRAARGKGNFVETMLRLAKERPELRIVADQRCTPTSTEDLAEAVVAILRERPDPGVYHATNSGECSWREFASEIFRLAGLTPRVISITAAEFAAKARRPDYSVLSTAKLERAVAVRLRPWQAALQSYLRTRS